MGRAPARLAPARRAADALERVPDFVAAAPGARELVAITKAWELGRRERWDKGTRRLRPRGRRRARRAATASGCCAPRRRSPRSRASGRSPPGAKVVALLEDPARSAIVAVALPAEMPVTETLELEAALAGAVGRPLDAIVVNGVLPRRFSAADVERVLARDGAVPGAGGRGRAPPARAGQHAAGPAAPPAPPQRAPTWPRCPTWPRPTSASRTCAAWPTSWRGGSSTPPARARAPRRREPGRGRLRASGPPSAPRPVSERTSSSSNERSSSLARLAEHRPQPAAEEADRDRDEAREGQRRRRALRVRPRPHRRAEDDHDDRGDDAEGDADERARRVEAPPGQREDQRREVRARREDEGHAHEHRDVEAGAHEQRADDRRDADADGGDARHLALGLLVLAAAEVGPQVVRDRRPTPR